MSPLVEKALNAISKLNNLSSGLSHPNDSSRTKEILSMLKKEGDVLDANEIYYWAIKNKWTQDGAKELKDLLDKLNSGKSLRPSQKNMWRENILEMWKEEIKSKS